MISFGDAPSFWAWLADVATTVGVAAAIFGGVVALFSYRSASRASENAHMHTLFRDYLRMRFDYGLGSLDSATLTETAGSNQQPAPARKGSIRPPDYSIAEQLAGLKLYALEEMWVWVRRQERAFMLKWPMKMTRRSRERRDFLNAWRATILVHANQDRTDAAESILGFTHCYSVPFLEFIAEGWEGDKAAFKRIVSKQKSQRDGRGKGRTRLGKPGRRERHCSPDEARERAPELARGANDS